MSFDGFRQLEEAQRALNALHGNITTVELNPDDPLSVHRAIRKMEAAVDAKVARFRGNPLVDRVVEVTKDNLRERLLSRAQECR